VLSIKQVKAVLKEYNIRPSKYLGQNFLIDRNIQGKIINALDIKTEDTMLEIGPGMGALTGELCKWATKVIAIEKDRRLCNFLLQNHSYAKLDLFCDDILKYDFKEMRGLKVVGNLPYYISSPILTYLLDNRPSIGSIFITVQKEFAERLVAGPGTKDYSSISCFTQFYAEPEILFNIRRRCFYPVPEVESCFLKVCIREKGLFLTNEDKLFKIIRTCFGKRRKTILNSLSSNSMFGDKEAVEGRLKDIGIDPGRRPETLSIEEFVRVSDGLPNPSA